MNTFGSSFQMTTWGESHGGGIGVIVNGCPVGIAVDIALIQSELDRRRPGQSSIVTPRKEKDICRILSGIENGFATGEPIAAMVDNTDSRPEAYDEMKLAFRPSHGDYAYFAKYGIHDHRGGGRSSARETIARVIAGAIAKAVLANRMPTFDAVAYVSSVYDIDANVDLSKITRDSVEATAIRCPDHKAALRMIALIKKMRSEANSVGGVISCLLRGCPPQLYSSLSFRSDLAKGMLSLPAVKGFVCDEYYFRVAFKPVATIARPQKTVTRSGEAITLLARGRHDPCVLPRAVPIVEAMAYFIVCDHMLQGAV